MPRVSGRSAWFLAALLAALVAASGCGGDDKDEDGGGAASSDAAKGVEKGGGSESSPDLGDSDDSYRPFIEEFRRITGVQLKPVSGDLFGTRLEVPARPNRFIRFGAYSLTWTKNEDKRDLFIGGGDPDDDGIVWRRTGSTYSANKTFGPKLVLRWVGRKAKRTNEQWDRLERAVSAAFEKKPGDLPEEERPCPDANLNPLKGDTGKCSLSGIPITFANANDTLRTPTFDVRIRGVDTADKLRFSGLAPLVPKGQFMIVAYEVRNASNRPIRFVQPQLRLDGRLLAQSPEAAGLLPHSGRIPLAPGAKFQGQAAFDVPTGSGGTGGAFVLPAGQEGEADPSLELAQGWVRMAGAHRGLPRAAKDKTTTAQ